MPRPGDRVGEGMGGRVGPRVDARGGGLVGVEVKGWQGRRTGWRPRQPRQRLLCGERATPEVPSSSVGVFFWGESVSISPDGISFLLSWMCR